MWSFRKKLRFWPLNWSKEVDYYTLQFSTNQISSKYFIHPNWNYWCCLKILSNLGFWILCKELTVEIIIFAVEFQFISVRFEILNFFSFQTPALISRPLELNLVTSQTKMAGVPPENAVAFLFQFAMQRQMKAPLFIEVLLYPNARVNLALRWEFLKGLRVLRVMQNLPTKTNNEDWRQSFA